ncbi:hypothetical protein GCM10010304_79890 [Streptomyces roseoviolaceus]
MTVGGELSERGGDRLRVRDQVLCRFGALVGGLEPVGETGPVLRFQFDLRCQVEDVQVRFGGGL